MCGELRKAPFIAGGSPGDPGDVVIGDCVSASCIGREAGIRTDSSSLQVHGAFKPGGIALWVKPVKNLECQWCGVLNSVEARAG